MASTFIKELIGKGYFPQEITPWFTTKKLTDYLDLISANISKYPQRTSKPCKYTIPKGN